MPTLSIHARVRDRTFGRRYAVRSIVRPDFDTPALSPHVAIAIEHSVLAKRRYQTRFGVPQRLKHTPLVWALHKNRRSEEETWDERLQLWSRMQDYVEYILNVFPGIYWRKFKPLKYPIKDHLMSEIVQITPIYPEILTIISIRSTGMFQRFWKMSGAAITLTAKTVSWATKTPKRRMMLRAMMLLTAMAECNLIPTIDPREPYRSAKPTAVRFTTTDNGMVD
ncbi:hypothetical protein BCR34DRAFT_295138 [Clohesyomyces aquaticus]|uniref:Uncharacterized protein n=1 Tax=Clohesyomyces aquaticus TaxID=1231657 RepID=A0A1Y2A8H5_9PLEO|nr:hypothetical protein BCR34DRAFT_295138 [Clohesyomyces aquaticus]